MFKSVIRTSLIFMLPFACVTAHAENYIGANIGRINSSESLDEYGIPGDLDIEPWTVNARLGHTFNTNFSAELRWGTNISSEKVHLLGETVDVDLNKVWGAYLRAGLPLETGLLPYVVVGYSEVKFTASIDGFGSVADSTSDVSYGVGLDLKAGENYVLNAEYIRLQDDDDIELDMLSVGLAINF